MTIYMAFGYCASLFPWQNKKHLWPFYLTIWTSIFSQFTSYNSDFIRIVRYCKCTIAKRKMIWDKVTITLYPLYPMAKISFHSFHLCKGKKQTNIKNAKSNTHFHSFLLPLLKIFIYLSLSNSVLFYIHKTNSKRYFLLYVVVDVMERASTADYSSNWDWNQLFLNISVICYLKMFIMHIFYIERLINTFELLMYQK